MNNDNTMVNKQHNTTYIIVSFILGVSVGIAVLFFVLYDARQNYVDIPASANTAEVSAYVIDEPFLVVFSQLTELQQKEWNNLYAGKYNVTGTCPVFDVGSTGIFSSGNASYEIICKMPGRNRLVLYYTEDQRDYVMGIAKGDLIRFNGWLMSMRDWGLWVTGYIRIEA